MTCEPLSLVTVCDAFPAVYSSSLVAPEPLTEILPLNSLVPAWSQATDIQQNSFYIFNQFPTYRII